MAALSKYPIEPKFEVRFQSLFDAGRAFTFPCDEQGHVDLDGLSERARHNYFYARAVVGREFAPAAVQPCRAR
jgi:hypothetical protein